jgi:hypothetical protein
MQVSYFPCAHEVGCRPVVWFRPEEELPRDPEEGEEPQRNQQEAEGPPRNRVEVEGPVEIIENLDEWILPLPRTNNQFPRIGQKNEWHKEAESISGFAETLALEVAYISKQRLPHTKLAATLATRYERYRHPKGQKKADTGENRSDFRIKWWLKAKHEIIQLK